MSVLHRSRIGVMKAWFRSVQGLRARHPEHCLRPDIFLIGTNKSGSTTLHDLLLRHPGIIRATRKEIDWGLSGHPDTLDWYLPHFPHRAEVALAAAARGRRTLRTLDGSVRAMTSGAFVRLHEHFPDGRYVVILRDPAARAISGYHQLRGRMTEPIEVALDPSRLDPALTDIATWREVALGPARSEHDDLRRPGRHDGRIGAHLVLDGLYVQSLVRTFAVIPRAQVQVIRAEDLFASPQTVWDDLLTHLQLDPHPMPARAPRNIGSYARDDVPGELRAALHQFYSPWNALLAQYLDRPTWD